MSNLFILGNGFDVSHGLSTKYNDFKKFFEKTILIYDDAFRFEKSVPQLPPLQIHSKNGKVCDYIAEFKLLYWLINNAANGLADMEWKRFEELLGRLDFKKVIDKYNNEQDVVSIMSETLNTLEEIFFLWIKQIDVKTMAKPKQKLSNVISKDDFALVFNYTETLEIVYGFPRDNICYIHGRRETNNSMSTFGDNNEKLVVGHDGKWFETNVLNSKENNEDLKKKLISLYTYLQKDGESIVQHNKCFYDKISKGHIDNIYSYGFSYAGVDKLQIEKICEVLNKGSDQSKSIIWLLNEFDEKNGNNEEYRKTIRTLGFKGEFKTFDTN